MYKCCVVFQHDAKDLFEEIGFNDLADYTIQYTPVLANGKVNNSHRVLVIVNSTMLCAERTCLIRQS